jgi:hypothetical protein
MDQQLLKYIQEARAAAMSDSEIWHDLSQAGWSDDDINTALRAVQARGTRAAVSVSRGSRNRLAAALLLFLVPAGILWYRHSLPRNSVLPPSAIRVAASPPTAVAPNPQPSTDSLVYQNSLFGFQLTYNRRWRIAVPLSRLSAAHRQSLYLTQGDPDRLGQCEEDPKCKADLNARVQTFLDNWTPESSEVVVLTDLSQEREQSFVNTANPVQLSSELFPRNHWIKIFVRDTVPSLTWETSPTSALPLKVKTINVSNVIKAQQLDSGQQPDGERQLYIWIPHVFNVLLGSGKEATSLEILTSTDPGNTSEKEFWDVSASVSFR